MARNFGSLVFTPTIKAHQETYGSRRAYARQQKGDPAPDGLEPHETDFIAEHLIAGLRPAFSPRIHGHAVAAAPNLRAALLRVALGGSNPVE